MKFIHGIVTVNREDLLAKAVASIEPVWADSFILDNSKDGLTSVYPIRVIRPSVPLSCSQSMNFLVKLAKEAGADVFGYMHNDAYCLDVQQIRIFYDTVKMAFLSGEKWMTTFSFYQNIRAYYDALSGYSMKAIEEVGLWDTRFPNPNYHIDSDWFKRAKKRGYFGVNSPAKIFHAGSQTTRSDDSIGFVSRLTARMNNEYWNAKWGPKGGEYDIAFEGKESEW